MDTPTAPPRPRAPRRLRALGGGLAWLIFSLIGALVLIEGLLWAASVFAPERSGKWREGAVQRVLCVGDSHTWGAGVQRPESYPAQLQGILDAEAPGRYSVMNIGLPGMNTSQIRAHLPEWSERYRPDVVVLWAGVNNAWNVAERRNGESVSRGERWLAKSRLYRFWRVWQRDQRLLREHGEQALPAQWSHELVELYDPKSKRERRAIRHEGGVEYVEHQRVAQQDPQVVRATADADLAAIAAFARRAGIELIYVTYPLRGQPTLAASLALWRQAQTFGLPLVASWASLQRVPEASREWRANLHPGPVLYGEIAQDIAQAIRRPSRFVPAVSAEELERRIYVSDEVLLHARKHLLPPKERAASPPGTPAPQAPPVDAAAMADCDLECMRTFTHCDLACIGLILEQELRRDAPETTAALYDPISFAITLRIDAMQDGVQTPAESAYIGEFLGVVRSAIARSSR